MSKKKGNMYRMFKKDLPVWEGHEPNQVGRVIILGPWMHEIDLFLQARRSIGSYQRPHIQHTGYDMAQVIDQGSKQYELHPHHKIE
jgi:hypothetical protein